MENIKIKNEIINLEDNLRNKNIEIKELQDIFEKQLNETYKMNNHVHNENIQ